MARARRRARVEHNRQLPWLLPWQLPLPLPCRRRHRDTSAPPSQLPRPAAADADRGGTSSRAARRRRARCNGNGNFVDTVYGACHTNKKITPKHSHVNPDGGGACMRTMNYKNPHTHWHWTICFNSDFGPDDRYVPHIFPGRSITHISFEHRTNGFVSNGK